jgi:membrane-associated protease RseP (regulator of RpoE activity)
MSAPASARLLCGLALSLSLAATAHAGGDVELPRLGLRVADVTPAVARQAGLDQVKGCLVEVVVAGSPAAEGGVQLGDIIVSLNNRGIRDARELSSDIAGLDPGEVVKMCVVRDDYRTTVYVTLGEAPPRAPRTPGWLGVEVANVREGSLESARLNEEGKEGGVVVKQVEEGSPAARAGIEAGDVIMSFNSRKVRTVKELAADINGASPGDRVRICIMRGEIRKTLYPVLESPPRPAVSLTAGEVEQERRVPSRSQLTALFPGATRFDRELQPVKHYRAYRSAQMLGVAFVTTEVCPRESEGYQGPISTLVGLSVAGKITGVTLLYHTESVKKTGDHLEQFVKQYVDRDAAGPFVLGGDVDAITGATVTSSAINRSIEVGSRIVLTEVLGSAPAARSSGPGLTLQLVVWNLDAVLLLGVVALALWGYTRGDQTVRFVVLGMGLVFLGYLKGGGLSVHDAINVAEGHLPPFASTVYWYTLVVLVGLTALLIGRFYCGWLCPFGALSEMLYRALPRLRIRVPSRVDQLLRLLKYLVLTVILLALLFMGQARTGAVIEIVEPFETLFRLSGTLLSWVTVAFFLASSVFVSRAYCRYVCPLGALLALVVVGVSLVSHVASRGARPLHLGPPGACPVDAVRHERRAAETGVRSGECIACSRRHG